MSELNRWRTTEEDTTTPTDYGLSELELQWLTMMSLCDGDNYEPE